MRTTPEDDPAHGDPQRAGRTGVLLAGADLHLAYDGAAVVHGAGLTLRAGEDALALHPRDFARRVTLLSQSRPVPTGVTVREVVGYGRHPHRARWRGTDPDGDRTIAWAMDVTGVARMAGRAVDELSGGELQRVWLAGCLAQDTEVLLLDEPTNHLDLRDQVEILDLVRDLADEHGVAVGVVLHDLEHAAAVADTVALLQGGRVVAAGTPTQVLTGPALSAAYGIRIDVTTDDRTGRVRTHPVGRHTARRAARLAALVDAVPAAV